MEEQRTTTSNRKITKNIDMTSMYMSSANGF